MEPGDVAEAALPPNPPPPLPPDEPLFRAALELVRTQKPQAIPTGLIFIALFVVFILGQVSDIGLGWGLLILVAVLLFHEGGHALGMWLFGFKNVRMFFIPFFGAAVSGKARGAAAWKEAVVSLLGPVPGIVLGVAGLFLVGRHPSALLGEAVGTLLFLNVFNLLPLGGLDGGRFLGQVLFSRHRLLDVAFQSLGSLALVGIGLLIDSWMLAVFAGLGLLALPRRWVILGLASGLKPHAASAKLGEVDEVFGRRVFDAARPLFRDEKSATPQALADVMDSIIEAVKPAPGILATLALSLLWFAALFVGVVATSLSMFTNGPANWQVLQTPAFHVDFPGHALTSNNKTSEQAAALSAEAWSTSVKSSERYNIVATTWQSAEQAQQHIEAERASVARDTRLEVVETVPTTVAGKSVEETHFQRPGRVARSRFIVEGETLFVLTASAPQWGPDQERFFSTFGFGQAPSAPDAGTAH